MYIFATEPGLTSAIENLLNKKSIIRHELTRARGPTGHYLNWS